MYEVGIDRYVFEHIVGQRRIIGWYRSTMNVTYIPIPGALNSLLNLFYTPE